MTAGAVRRPPSGTPTSATPRPSAPVSLPPRGYPLPAPGTSSPLSLRRRQEEEGGLSESTAGRGRGGAQGASRGAGRPRAMGWPGLAWLGPSPRSERTLSYKFKDKQGEAMAARARSAAARGNLPHPPLPIPLYPPPPPLGRRSAGKRRGPEIEVPEDPNFVLISPKSLRAYWNGRTERLA